MTLFLLPEELLLLIIWLALKDLAREPVTSLLLPINRQDLYERSSLAYSGSDLESCLTPHAPATALVLSLQATACADQRKRRLPLLIRLSHVSSRLRHLILHSPLLWADQALCLPAKFNIISRRANTCPLTLISLDGLCACVFSDIRTSLPLASRIQLILPSLLVRCDYAILSTARLVHDQLTRCIHLASIELRMDSHRVHGSPETPLPYLSLPGLRSVRFQNIPFIIAGPLVEVLHVSAETGGQTFSLAYLLHALRDSARLRILALQDVWDGQDWTPGSIDPIFRSFALPNLEHATFSGQRKFAAAVFYSAQVPGLVDLHVDGSYDLGRLPAPEEVIPRMLIPEVCVLLNPAAAKAMIDFALRAWANGDGEGSSPEDFSLVRPPRLPVLALNIAPDYEASSPRQMWPLFVTLCFAQDVQDAELGLAARGDPVSHGPGRHRRTITLRNGNAAFPSDAVSAREGFPRDFRPYRLVDAASYLITAYTNLSYSGDYVTQLVLDEASWVPEDEDGWLFLLSDLAQLRRIEVRSRTTLQCPRGLAGYLAEEEWNECLTDITFRNSGLSAPEALAFCEELDGITKTRESLEGGGRLPHITWAVL